MTRTCLIAALLLSFPLAAQAQEKACECSDIPRLEKELFLQEFLQQESRKYDKSDPMNEGYYDSGSTDNFKNILNHCAELFQQGYPDCSAPTDGGHGSTTHGQEENKDTSAELGTNVFDKKCALEHYKHNADGSIVLDKDKNPITEPTTPKDYRNRKDQGNNCKIDNDFVLAHEAQHAKVCTKAWAGGHGSDYQNPSFFAADDAKAYGAGIKALRAGLAKLSKDCGWEGSSNPKKNDKNKPDKNKPNDKVDTVPTPEQAKKLSSALMKGRGK
jgi:hypothetical protein